MLRNCWKLNWTTYEIYADDLNKLRAAQISAFAKIKNSYEQAIQEINEVFREPVSNPNKLD